MLVAGLRAGSSASADSTANGVVYSANGCRVSVPGGTSYGAKYWTNNGTSMTAQFTISGNSDCSQAVTFASWQAPNSTFKPLDEQVLYAHTTKTYGLGTHTINVSIPDCYFQADLLVGTSPTASDGTPNYAWGQTIGNLEAGNQKCTTPTPAPTPSPTTPSPTAPTAAQPTALVNTGPGAVIVIGILAILGGYIFHMTHRHLKHKRRSAHHR